MVTDKRYGGVSTVTVSSQAIPVYLAVVVTVKIRCVLDRGREKDVVYQICVPRYNCSDPATGRSVCVKIRVAGTEEH
jgi:hypothetical protein